MKQYLLKDDMGYYWIWHKLDLWEKPRLSGPHSEPMINLPVNEVESPYDFKPPIENNR